MTTHNGLILAGGSGRRLGGRDKAELVVAGRSLLVRATEALASAERIVVVGDVGARVGSLSRDRLEWTLETPPGGGPVAGLNAGLVLVESPMIAVLAVDVPLVRAATVEELVASGVTADAAMLLDAEGRRQPLIAAYRTDALRAAITRIGEPAGASMRDLVKGLAVIEISAHPDETLDCDTWEDVERARRILEES